MMIVYIAIKHGPFLLKLLSNHYRVDLGKTASTVQCLDWPLCSKTADQQQQSRSAFLCMGMKWGLVLVYMLDMFSPPTGFLLIQQDLRDWGVKTVYILMVLARVVPLVEQVTKLRREWLIRVYMDVCWGLNYHPQFHAAHPRGTDQRDCINLGT